MVIKKFHLKDFPADRIRILLSDNDKFIDDSINYFGSLKKLANFLSVSPQVIHFWKKLNLFIPLVHIKKIVNKRGLDWNEIESNVITYKGPNSSLAVKNPKLPIIESPELFALIAHLIGDGSVNKNNIPIYTNSNKDLIDNFQKLISSVFGDVDEKIYYRNSGCYDLRSPRVIADLIKFFYNIDFKTRNAIIPERIKDLPIEFSVALIRAFADDEGNVDLNHKISIYSTNKNILLSIKELLTGKLDFSDVQIAEKSESYFYLTIKPKEIEKYFQVIGFNHPTKLNKLSKLIEIRNNYNGVRRKNNETKEEIIDLLSSENLSTEELIFKLGVRKSNVNMPLKDLYKKGLITKSNKIGQKIIWTKLEV
ncbi:ArsR family transcriptional regulator [Candidatus Woesearchaeota archaeon]|nr:ArsR family transcriptional regulator [Candidatus Woesearchaeota archaeon]